MRQELISFTYENFGLTLDVNATFKMHGIHPDESDNWALYDFEVEDFYGKKIETNYLGFEKVDSISKKVSFVSLDNDIKEMAFNELNRR